MTGQDVAVVMPWDTPGMAPRARSERCGRHSGCAYRDDDPARCLRCHRAWAVMAETQTEHEDWCQRARQLRVAPPGSHYHRRSHRRTRR